MIDETSKIDASAEIAAAVEIGPWSIIGPNVSIGSGTKIGSHVVIKSDTKIGLNNQISSFSSLGDDPQHANYNGEQTVLEIGDHNIIREYCTLNRGTHDGGSLTRIGNNNYIMAYVHIGHDCKVENHTIFVNNASLAGHVKVANHATIGPFVAIHQRCNIGAYSFLAYATGVNKDILPYVMVAGGINATVRGINSMGLKRSGFDTSSISAIRRAYSTIFRSKLTIKEVIPELEGMLPDSPAVGLFIKALQEANRSFVR